MSLCNRYSNKTANSVSEIITRLPHVESGLESSRKSLYVWSEIPWLYTVWQGTFYIVFFFSLFIDTVKEGISQSQSQIGVKIFKCRFFSNSFLEASPRTLTNLHRDKMTWHFSRALTVSFSQCNPTYVRGNFGIKLQNSPKLPHIHARLYCDANEKS